MDPKRSANILRGVAQMKIFEVLPSLVEALKESAAQLEKLEAIAKAAQELYYAAPPANTTVPPAHVSRYEAALCELYDVLEDANLLEEQQA